MIRNQYYQITLSVSKPKGKKERNTHSDTDKSSRKTHGKPNIKQLLHGPSMFAVKAKIYGVPIINPALSLLVIGQRQRAPNFSACHCSPHGSLVSIGQHCVTTRVVHLLKRTNTSLITEADLITESDQAVRAVHSCNSCFFKPLVILLP